MEIEDPSNRSLSVLEDYHVELDDEVAPIPVLSEAEVSFEAPSISIHADTLQTTQINENAEPLPVNTPHSTDINKSDIDTMNTNSTPNNNNNNNNTIETIIANSTPTTYSYFTPSDLVTAWAGPSYWKLRKGAKTKKAPVERVQKAKKKQIIEFSKDLVVKPTVLFPAVKRTSDLTINDSTFESGDLHVLPDDYHYNIDVAL